MNHVTETFLFTSKVKFNFSEKAAKMCASKRQNLEEDCTHFVAFLEKLNFTRDLRVPLTTSFNNKFSLFQIEKKKENYKKCWPYMVSVQKIFSGENCII